MRDFTAASSDVVASVTHDLRAAGALRVQVLPDSNIIHATFHARDASVLLATPSGFHRFHHAATNQTLLRTVEHYSLPSSVARHVDHVGGVSRLPRVGMAVVRSRTPTTPSAVAASATHTAPVPTSVPSFDSSAPVVYQISGGATQTTFFRPVCPGGKTLPAFGYQPCTLASVTLSASPHAPQFPAFSVNAAPPAVCGPCSKFKVRRWCCCDVMCVAAELTM